MTGPNQSSEGEDDAGSSADGGGDGRAGDAKAWERTEPENETRSEENVDGVREPEHAHRDGRVASASKHGVYDEQHQHGAAAAEHDARVAGSYGEDACVRAHDLEQVRRGEAAANAE